MSEAEKTAEEMIAEFGVEMAIDNIVTALRIMEYHTYSNISKSDPFLYKKYNHYTKVKQILHDRLQ